MPMLTAQKHQWTKQPPYNFYHFPNEHKAAWATFWDQMDGDLDKVIEFADKAGIECPCEWVESLHRFLFDSFVGNPKVFKRHAASEKFGTFLKELAKNHQEEPKDKDWYLKKGVSARDFVAIMERAAEIKDVRQAVAYINARVLDLGFHLYSEFILNKAPGKKSFKSIASTLNKKAYEAEKAALGELPTDRLVVGNSFSHRLFPNDKFLVVDVEKTASGDMKLITARDQNGHVSFICDFWNVRV